LPTNKLAVIFWSGLLALQSSINRVERARRKTFVFLVCREAPEGKEPVVGSGREVVPESQDRRLLAIVSERDPKMVPVCEPGRFRSRATTPQRYSIRWRQRRDIKDVNGEPRLWAEARSPYSKEQAGQTG
jgi:hypothetical protein